MGVFLYAIITFHGTPFESFRVELSWILFPVAAVDVYIESGLPRICHAPGRVFIYCFPGKHARLLLEPFGDSLV